MTKNATIKMITNIMNVNSKFPFILKMELPK